MNHIDMFSSLHYYIDNFIQNPNFGSFLIFLNLINNKIKLYVTIYGLLDLYKSYGFKLAVIGN